MKRFVLPSLLGILLGGSLGYLWFYLTESSKRLSEQEVWKRLSQPVWRIQQPPRKPRQITKKQSEFLEKLWQKEAEFLSKLYHFYGECLREKNGKKALEGLKKYLQEAPTHKCRIHVITLLDNLAKVIPFWEKSQTGEARENGKVRRPQVERSRSTR